MNRKPYGYLKDGKVYRKWRHTGHFLIPSYSETITDRIMDDKSWHQLPLSSWDYSTGNGYYEIVEWQRLKEMEHAH